MVQDTTLSIIRCQRDDISIALPIDHLERIVFLPMLQDDPRAPHYIVGLATIEGNVIPIADLLIILRDVVTRYTINTTLLIYCVNNQRFGLVVDDAYGLATLSSESIGHTSLSKPVLIDGSVHQYIETTALAEMVFTNNNQREG